MKKGRKKSVLIVILSLGVVFSGNAQEVRRGTMIVCDDVGLKDNHFHGAPPSKFLEIKQNKSATSRTQQTSTFLVEYNGFTDEAKAAFQFAVDIWESIIISEVPIRINANWSVAANINNLGSAISDEARNFEGAPEQNVWYPIPLAEKLARKEINGVNTFDILANFNAGRDDWYLGTDGNTPDGEFDLVTVVLHEIGHGLGFRASMFISGNGEGSYGAGDLSGAPLIYDAHISNGIGQSLLDESLFENGSIELANQLTSNNLIFDSPISVDQTGSNPRLYAPAVNDPGSSISHLDEGNYSGTIDGLMTPFSAPAESNHDPGPLTSFIFADMGYVHTFIEHEPIKDSEVTIPSAEITIISDSSIVESSVKLHYSYDDFNTSTTVDMNANAIDFDAIIPTPGDEGIISYYFSVVDVFGRNYFSPSNGEIEPFTFFFGEDKIAPEISHDAIGDITLDQVLIPISVIATDNIGIDSVYVEFNINADVQPGFGLIYNASLDVFEGVLDLTGNINAGDVITYKIKAIDNSSQNNETNFPAFGNLSFSVRVFEPQTTYQNDFEVDNDEFEGAFYTINTPQGFSNNAIHSEHPYPDADMMADYYYQLRFPIIVQSENPVIEFDEVVLVEPGDNDFVVVEGSSDNGNNWIPLLDSYDASDNTLWLDYYNSDLDENDSEAIGTLNFFASRSIDISENFSAGETILIRFRLHVNEDNNGWGWAIDNLNIQGNITGLQELLKSSNDLSIYPNPSRDSQVTISASFAQTVNNIRVTFYDLQGKALLTNTYSNAQVINDKIDISLLTPGLYIAHFNIDGYSVTQKVMLE